MVGAAAGCSFASQHRYMTGAGSEFLLGVVVFSHVTGGLCTLPPHRLACPEAIRVTGWWCWGGSPNLEFPHSSLGFHASIPRKKQRSSQQTVIFIVFTAELLQYSTESHEIKLLLKTRPKKIKHRKQTKKPVVWLLLQIYFHELYIQRSLANYLFIHLLIFGCFL